jgi:ElaB/YqjD/DUF883 family membrane-anchored ribosome-binding protein
MDTAVKQQHANAPVRQVPAYDRSKEKLLADLKLVVLDVEILIADVASASNEQFAILRAGFEKNLSEVKGRLVRAKNTAGDKSRHAAETAQAYVAKNPWRSSGLLALAVVIAGLCMGWRAAGEPVDGSINKED